jgi:hypothetical protein
LDVNQDVSIAPMPDRSGRSLRVTVGYEASLSITSIIRQAAWCSCGIQDHADRRAQNSLTFIVDRESMKGRDLQSKGLGDFPATGRP